MLDTEDLDIVSVCTYTVDPSGHDLHTEITLYCIEKGVRPQRGFLSGVGSLPCQSSFQALPIERSECSEICSEAARVETPAYR
jgi:hypothetical protein